VSSSTVPCGGYMHDELDEAEKDDVVVA